ncbi:hypothetical protein BRC82_04435 [Halobacteriales archaeon QS_1_67_19]|nr:MAG: hypothetical protein BRC82_04435 [Halobacteriales archaeon QS_1_67_19]
MTADENDAFAGGGTVASPRFAPGERSANAVRGDAGPHADRTRAPADRRIEPSSAHCYPIEEILYV